MSESAKILENEKERGYSPVDRVKVNNQGGGSSNWVVSDNAEMDSLDVSENGAYFAANDDLYAYDTIVVNVTTDLADADDLTQKTKKITGKDPNLDPNNDYAVGLEDGNLTKELLPSAIHIVVPPRKLKYEVGETLDFTGIYVYLMDGNGNRFTNESYPTGRIPFEELMFDPTVAIADSAVANVKGAVTFIEYKATEWPRLRQIRKVYNDEAYAVFARYNEYNTPFLFGLTSESVVTQYREYDYYDDQWRPWYDWEGQSNYKGFFVSEIAGVKGEIESSTIPFFGAFNSKWDLYDAVIDIINNGGGKNNVTVSWMRSDGEILEDTFEIEIGESEEGQEQPDPWGGAADVSWDGHHYNFNRKLVPPVQYANGYCWRQAASEYAPEYTVEQAARLGWLILIR